MVSEVPEGHVIGMRLDIKAHLGGKGRILVIFEIGFGVFPREIEGKRTHKRMEHRLRALGLCGIFTRHETDEVPDFGVRCEMKPDVFVRKLVRLWRKKEMEERGVSGKGAQIFSEKQLFFYVEADHDDLLFAFDAQRVAAVGLADIAVAFGEMKMVAVLRAQHIIAVLADEVDEEEILFVKFLQVMGSAERDDHNIFIGRPEPLGNEFSLYGKEIPREAGKRLPQSVKGSTEYGAGMRKNHELILSRYEDLP